MRRPAIAGPILAAMAALALLLAGCGGSSHRSSSTAAGGSPTTSTSTATGGSPITSTSTAAATTTTMSSPGSGRPAAGGRLTVSPAAGHPSSTLRFTLVAPSAAGRHGQTELSYGLSIAGEQGAGCVAQHADAVPVGHAGVPATVAVGPAQLGGHWCAGSYTARVDELAHPVCSPGQVCPQFIRVVAVIGPVRFRITP
jgi:hypothetical protein